MTTTQSRTTSSQTGSTAASRYRVERAIRARRFSQRDILYRRASRLSQNLADAEDLVQEAISTGGLDLHQQDVSVVVFGSINLNGFSAKSTSHESRAAN
jgi:hypothetical protein